MVRTFESVNKILWSRDHSNETFACYKMFFNILQNEIWDCFLILIFGTLGS